MRLPCSALAILLILITAIPLKAENEFNLKEIEVEIVRAQIAVHIEFLGGLDVPYVCLRMDDGDPSDELMTKLQDALIQVRKISQCSSPVVELWISDVAIIDHKVRALGGLNIEDKRIALELYTITKEDEKNIHVDIKQIWFISNESAPKQSI